MDFRQGLSEFPNIACMCHLVECIHDLVLQLRIRPPYRYGAFSVNLICDTGQYRAVNRFSVVEVDGGGILDLNGLGNRLIVGPPLPDFVFCAVGRLVFFVIKVHIIIFEHGHAVGQIPIVAQ